MVMISIGAHALLLFAPIPEMGKPKPEEPSAEDLALLTTAISVEELPRLAAPEATAPVAQAPQPEPTQPKPQPTQAVQQEPELLTSVPEEPQPDPEAEPEPTEEPPEDSEAPDEEPEDENNFEREPVPDETPPADGPVTHNGSNYDKNAGQMGFVGWYQAIVTEFPTVGMQRSSQTIAIDPKNTSCRDPKPNSEIAAGILIGADGLVIGEPGIFQDSGYDDLNEQIKETLKQWQPTEHDGTIKAYPLIIEITDNSATCTAI
jgi:outer membrane biosynthesis protein TonB